jgi:uncharacterized OB-fold protein
MWADMGELAHLLFLKGDKAMDERPFSDITYEQLLNEEKLMGSKCKECGALFSPPRPICIKCYRAEMEWVELKGKGKLVAFTSITVGPPWMVEQGYDREHPYCSGVVELEEGTSVVARIEGVDASRPETIKIGMPVTVEFLHHGEGDKMQTYLAFKPL